MESLSLIQRFAIWVIPVIFAITVHEVAHGWAAKKLGDQTALMLGRLSLNPIRHIDPIGSILVPGLLLMFSGFIFGWAKPVPINWKNLKHPKRDMAIVALAGPFANLCMAIFWVLLLKIGIVIFDSWQWIALPMVYMSIAGIAINIILMVLNLLPLPPLDGSRVLMGVLPGSWSYKLSRIEPYGLIILMVLLFTGILGKILWPISMALQNMLAWLAGLPPELYLRALFALMGN